MREKISEYIICTYLKWLVLVLLFSCVIHLWASEPAENTCSLDYPPHDAAVNQIHGSFFFIYPRKIPPLFTGCQTMWDELGRKTFVLYFNEGNLNKYLLTDYSGHETSEICNYENDKLTSSSSSSCSSYEDMKNGLYYIAPEYEPSVPRNRDARLIQ